MLDENLHLTKIEVSDDSDEVKVLWRKNLLLLDEIKHLQIAKARAMVITDRSITVRHKSVVYETGLCHNILDASTLQ